mmetsp:Transcript_6074/g.11414  ORF Transcript_6074/g.11414 Transcript_6074/m.11414 type:complete len:793 (+) Transcript_6074:44-2422(+)
MATNARSKEDLIYVCISDPVDLNPKLLGYWARGYTQKECLEFMKEETMREYDMGGVISQRQLHRLFRCIEKDIFDQFRVFSMLEPALRNPALRPFKAQPIPLELERKLIAQYFAIDDGVVREILRMRDNSRARKRLRDVAARLGVRLEFCTRQLDNIESVLENLVRRNWLRFTSRSSGSLRKVESPPGERLFSRHASSLIKPVKGYDFQSFPVERAPTAPATISSFRKKLWRRTSFSKEQATVSALEAQRISAPQLPARPRGNSVPITNIQYDVGTPLARYNSVDNKSVQNGAAASETAQHEQQDEKKFFQGRPACLFETIVAQDLAMPDSLARKYSSIIFLCRYRLETNRGRLATASLSDLIFIARTLMRHWTVRIVEFNQTAQSSSFKPGGPKKMSVSTPSGTRTSTSNSKQVGGGGFKLTVVKVENVAGVTSIGEGTTMGPAKGSASETPASVPKAALRETSNRDKDLKKSPPIPEGNPLYLGVRRENKIGGSDSKAATRDVSPPSIMAVASPPPDEGDLQAIPIPEEDIPVCGDSLDRPFLSRLENLRASHFLRDKQGIESFTSIIRSKLLDQVKRQQQNEVALSNVENDTKTKGTPLKSKSNDRLASIKMQSVSTPMNMASPAETRPSGSAKSVERSQQGKVGDGPDAPRGVGGGYADMRETPRLTTGGLAKIATRCNQVFRALILLAARVGQEREFRDLLLSLWGQVVLPILRQGVTREEATYFFELVLTTYPAESELRVIQDLHRFLCAVVPICIRLTKLEKQSSKGGFGLMELKGIKAWARGTK